MLLLWMALVSALLRRVEWKMKRWPPRVSLLRGLEYRSREDSFFNSLADWPSNVQVRISWKKLGCFGGVNESLRSPPCASIHRSSGTMFSKL
ncbi:hypothetical protein BJX62DRAFT_218489 [Aspergillus germanicus]